MPFLKAMKNQEIVADDGRCNWTDRFTLEGQPVDHILASNLSQYTALTKQEAERARIWRDNG